MSRFYPRSIRATLLIGTVGAIALTGAATYLLFSRTAARQSLGSMHSRAMGLAEGTAFMAAPLIAFDNHESIEQVLDALTRHPDFAYAILSDREHRFVERKDGFRAPPHTLANSADPRAEGDQCDSCHSMGDIPMDGNQSHPNWLLSDGMIHVTTAIVDNGEYWGRLSLGLSLDSMNRELARTRKEALLSVVTLSAVAVLLLWWLGKSRIDRPLRRLTLATNQVSRGIYPDEVPVGREDEIGVLTTAFNHMSSKLREADETRERIGKLEKSRQRAQEESKQKSQFLANMSHELRTPLNAIIGYSELLEEEAEELDQADFVADLRKIQSAGRHLLMLISDVLDLSKIEAGRMELHLEAFQISDIVREVADTVEPLAKKQGNSVVVATGDCPGAMYADMMKFRQSLFNLLSNACKFTENGTITLEVEPETVHGDEWVNCHVRDTGIGISPKQRKKLFKAFSQIDTSATRKNEGTGLGLTISKKFCQMMGGDISLESEAGQGSTFTIRIPRDGSNGEAKH